MRLLVCHRCFFSYRYFCSTVVPASANSCGKNFIEILGKSFDRDCKTKIPGRIQEQLSRTLHRRRDNPIYLVGQLIREYFHKNYRNQFSSPLHTYVDNLEPVVTTWQNFDSLLIPPTHPSRSSKETYYVNSDYVLR